MIKKTTKKVLNRIYEIEEELREIALLYDVTVNIETCLSAAPANKYKAASETTLCINEEKYKHNHYFDGRDDLHDGKFKTVNPEDIIIQMKADICDEDCFHCAYSDCMRIVVK